jgi:hypothetical protein
VERKEIKKGSLCKGFAMSIINRFYADGGGGDDVMTILVECDN